MGDVMDVVGVRFWAGPDALGVGWLCNLLLSSLCVLPGRLAEQSPALTRPPTLRVQIGQLLAIFQLLGTPGEPEWPGVSSMPDWSCHFPQWRPRDLAEVRCAFFCGWKVGRTVAVPVAQPKPPAGLGCPGPGAGALPPQLTPLLCVLWCCRRCLSWTP